MTIQKISSPQLLHYIYDAIIKLQIQTDKVVWHLTAQNGFCAVFILFSSEHLDICAAKLGSVLCCVLSGGEFGTAPLALHRHNLETD